MEKSILILKIFIILGLFSPLFSQETSEVFEYRRSSLSMILIVSDNFPNKEFVMNSWENYPFPDKYNQHNIGTKSIDLSAINLSDEDLKNAGFLSDTLSSTSLAVAEREYQASISNLATASLVSPLRYINNQRTLAVKLPSERQQYELKIEKVIKEKSLARQLVESWYNRKPDGSFDMSLIQERGYYNATEMEAAIAQGQTRGLASLADAGEELIKNTFVTFTRLEFIENEPVAAKIRDASKKEITETMAGRPQMLIDRALQGADAIYERSKEGYSLWSKTWLFKLIWNDSIAAVFYNELWNNADAFQESDLFELEFVGAQYNQSLVTFQIGETRTEDQIIDLALVRNIDNAFAKLQKENDVFKPKVPVISVDPIIAQIGKKEGLEGGENFEILEIVLNPRTGMTEYKRVGSTRVQQNSVWDNRYNIGEKPEVTQKDKSGNPNGTEFRRVKGVEPGMLLRQIN